MNKKKRSERNKQIHEAVKNKVLEMKEDFEEIIGNKKTAEEKENYKYWTILIVEQVEKAGKLTEKAHEAYLKMTSKYPQTTHILDELIKQVEMFSIYDTEPATINFDYSAYLKQINELITY